MEQEHRTLDGITAGQTVRVRAVWLTGTLRSRLLDLGMIPGTAVTCIRTGRGIAAYRIRGAVIAIRRADAAGIAIV